MSLKTILPSDLDDRIGGLGEAIAAACPEVLFAYLFGSAADRRLRGPETGAESFEILADASLLPGDLGRALALMVGFRNIPWCTTTPGWILRS